MTASPALFVFRADASLQMGSGHVMRCLTLADALTAAGNTCRFICREHEGNLITFMRSKGYRVDAMPLAAVPNAAQQTLAHSHWLGASQQQDAAQCIALLDGQMADWLVVDHYALDRHWQAALRQHCRRLLVIDDLADRDHDCDVLLDQTLGRQAQEYRARVPAGCRILAGPDYALLRPEFAQWRQYSLGRRQSACLHRVLVNLGGVDAGNVTGTVLEALAATALPDNIEITVVMGLSAPHLAAVTAQAARMRLRTTVISNADNMAELMANSDLAIGAAGSTSWERCCLGLPTIMLVLADNQKKACAQLVATRAAWSVSASSELSACLDRLIREPEQLKIMSAQGAAIVDGCGCSKVLTILNAARAET